MVADLFEHFAELAVAAFGEGELVPGVVAAADELDFGGGGDDAVATAAADLVEAAAVDHDAAGGSGRGRLAGGTAADFDQVGLFDSGGGLGERVGEVAVVGHEEQAFGEVVEAAYGVEADAVAVGAGDLLLGGFGDELHDGGALLGVFEGGDVAAGLVEHVVALCSGPLRSLPSTRMWSLGGVVAGAEGGDDGAR